MQKQNISVNHTNSTDGKRSYMDSDLNPRKKHDYVKDDYFKQFVELTGDNAQQRARTISPPKQLQVHSQHSSDDNGADSKKSREDSTVQIQIGEIVN